MSFESFQNDDDFKDLDVSKFSQKSEAQGEADLATLPEEHDDISDYLERDELPWLKPPNQKASIFKVLKDMIGKDITKFAVPVHFNEPLSMLQK